MTPAWILDILAALMLVVAAVSAGRIVAARPWQHGSVFTDTDVAHLLMGIAMAGTLAAGLSTLPNVAWDVIFALLTAWFAVRVVLDARTNGGRALAGGHCAPHLVHSAAMLYMFAALAPAAGGAGMSGMGSSGSATQTLRYPTLAFVFALILIGYTIWDLDQLSGRRYGTTPARARLTGVPAAVPALAGAGSSPSTLPGPQAEVTSTPASTTSLAANTDDGTAALDADRSGKGSAAQGLLLSPAVTVSCRIAMGATMAFMLIIMI